MKKTFFILSFLAFLLFSGAVVAQDNGKTIQVEGKVTEVKSREVTVEVTTSDLKGKTFSVPFIDESQGQRQDLQVGDEVVLSYTKQGSKEILYVVDHIRRTQLLILFAIFLAVVIVVGRWKGLLSFIGMIFSFVIIGRMIVPGIIAGTDPVVISLLGALFIIPVTFYIAHGLNRQTTIAVISTFLSLTLTGILAYIFVYFTRLTGFSAEEAVYIQALGQDINIRNLLLAGIIIGSMGVLDDITISQTSIVDKLVKANPKLTNGEIFKMSMEVGRDHIASLVNTLILVYAGAALPLFLLFYSSQLSYTQVVNQEIIATEIVRTLVSSIGIVAAVPLTTLLAAYVVRKK